MEKTYGRFEQGCWQGKRRCQEADEASTSERAWLLQKEQTISLFFYDSMNQDFKKYCQYLYFILGLF